MNGVRMDSTELTVIDAPGALPIAALADILEEEIWLAKQKSKRTRRAYKLDMQHFMRKLSIKTYDELRARQDAAGHADDLDGPMFRPLSHNRKGQEPRRHMEPAPLTACCASTPGPQVWAGGIRRIP